MSHDPTTLPADLPVPEDDGAADHLRGMTLPAISLPSTDGEPVDLRAASAGRRVVGYAYPRTGRPGADELVPDWDLIPGARGCTPESCAFRDEHDEFTDTGALLIGLSTQDTDYQAEAVNRLHLTFPLLSDADLLLTRALRLPTFQAAGHTLLRRLTLVLRDRAIEHVFYPVFQPDRHAAEVLRWLREHPMS